MKESGEIVNILLYKGQNAAELLLFYRRKHGLRRDPCTEKSVRGLIRNLEETDNTWCRFRSGWPSFLSKLWQNTMRWQAFLLQVPAVFHAFWSCRILQFAIFCTLISICLRIGSSASGCCKLMISKNCEIFRINSSSGLTTMTAGLYHSMQELGTGNVNDNGWLVTAIWLGRQ